MRMPILHMWANSGNLSSEGYEMKIDILSREEIHRIRHLSLIVKVEESGKKHQLSVVMIQEYDSRHKTYSYEIESFGWLTDQKDMNVKEIEMKTEEYLIDNGEDIFS
jgi:hypothetical protein